jgi:hypothetical protein
MSKTLDRIAKVLNQAENAATPEEAAAFMERAQHLSTLAQIDLAVARAHTVNKEKREEVEVRRVQVSPYSRRFNRKYFTDLGDVIAGANDCKCLFGKYQLIVTGFPSDIDTVEALFGILAVQMVSECDTALKRGANKATVRRAKRVRVPIPEEDRDWGGWNGRGYYAWDEDEIEDLGKSAPPSFTFEIVKDADGKTVYEEQTTSSVDGRLYRQNFYDGFIARTRSRLWEAKRAARQEAGADEENSSTALALRDKTEEVDKSFNEQLKTLNSRGTYYPASPSETVINAWEHGGDAAARAKFDLDVDNAVGASSKKEIG